MSSTARPRLNVCVNAAAAAESASATAEGISSATVARNSRPACMRALTRLYSCTWYLSPPSRNDAPSMNSVLVTIAPAMDAFTSMYSPGAQRGERDDQLGQVAQRGVEQPADRVARLGRHRLGGVAQQRGQRHDGEHGQHEQQRVRLGPELRGGEHHRHEGQQPEQRVVADFLEERVHPFTLVLVLTSSRQRASYRAASDATAPNCDGSLCPRCSGRLVLRQGPRGPLPGPADPLPPAPNARPAGCPRS